MPPLPPSRSRAAGKSSHVAGADCCLPRRDRTRRSSTALTCAAAASCALAALMRAGSSPSPPLLLGRRDAADSGDSFALAREQSLGFFDDVPDADWALARERIADVGGYRHPDPRESLRANRAWYMVNYEPNFTCLHERRIGGTGPGGRWVCDPHRVPRHVRARREEGGRERRRRGKEGCLVYSFVTGGRNSNDLAFEADVHASVSSDCEVHVFGAASAADRNTDAPPGLIFHPWRLKSGRDSSAGAERDTDGAPLKSLREIVALLGHGGRVVDVLRVSCGGCEWETFRDWFDGADVATPRQVLVDVHGAPDAAPDFFEAFEANHYATFHKEGDLTACGDSVVSYAFLRMSASFFAPETTEATAGAGAGGTERLDRRRGGSRDFDLARRQSLGFFDDVAERDWELLRRRVRDRGGYRARNPRDFMRHPSEWYMANYGPNFSCRHERRVGKVGDGAKWVCDPHRIPRQVEARRRGGGNGCLVYSVGSNGNFKFENSVRTSIMEDCEVHIFDVDDYSGQTPPGFHFHHWGLKSGLDPPPGQPPAGPRMKSLREIVSLLGHEGRTVDLFKVDCEKCEWETFREWFDAGVNLNQILVEVHWRTNVAVEFFEALQERGYVTFHKENNLMGDCTTVEYAFLRLDSEFSLP